MEHPVQHAPGSYIEHGKQLFFLLAQYNNISGELEFHDDYKNVLSRIQNACRSDSKLVFATAIGQPKSGKSGALSQLWNNWNRSAAPSRASKFPEDVSSSSNFQGIRLLFNDSPIISGHVTLHLVCLDVVCPHFDERSSLGYKKLMEACYRMSNLIIFTFSEKTFSDKVVQFDYRRPDVAAMAVSFNGYGEWDLKMPFHPDVQGIIDFLQHNNAPKKFEILQALSVLPPASLKVPVQFGNLILYSDPANNATPSIYGSLVNLLKDPTFRPNLHTPYNLQSDFEGMTSNTIGRNAKAAEATFVAEKTSKTAADSRGVASGSVHGMRLKDSTNTEVQYLPNLIDGKKTSERGNVSKEQQPSPSDQEKASKPKETDIDACPEEETTQEASVQTQVAPRLQERSQTKVRSQEGPSVQTPGPSQPVNFPSPAAPVIPFPKPDSMTLELQLKASFKKLALNLIASFGTAEPLTKDQCDGEINKWQQSWKAKISAEESEKLGNELKLYCGFFSSCQEICGKLDLHLDPAQLQQFEKQIKSNYFKLKNAVDYEKAHLLKATEAVMYNILSTIPAKNQAIIKVEELLVQTMIRTAWACYTSTIDNLLKIRVFNEIEILPYHNQIVQTVLKTFSADHREGWLWKQYFTELENRMTQNFPVVFSHNARNLAQLWKKTSAVYKACKLEFDTSFRQRSEFTSIQDLKSHAKESFSEGLKKAGIIYNNNISEYLGIKQNLRSHAFGKMMKVASSCPRALEVLADKCEITGVVREGQLEAIMVVMENEAPIFLDAHLWLKQGKLVIVETRHVPSFKRRYQECLLLDVNNFDTEHPVHKAIPDFYPNPGPERLMATYFDLVKKYLLAEVQLLPVRISLEVQGHRKSSSLSHLYAATHLAGLPSPTFWTEESRVPQTLSIPIGDDLLAWIRERVQTAEDPEEALVTLAALEKSEMKLRSVVEETNPQGNVQETERSSGQLPQVSNRSIPNLGRSQTITVMKEKIARLVDELEKGLQKPSVARVVARQAGIKLRDAKELLEMNDVSQTKLDLMIQMLQISINTVTGVGDN